MCACVHVCVTSRPQEVRSKETVMLVDRYKFMDLLPCSEVELKLIGHPVSGGGWSLKMDGVWELKGKGRIVYL